MSIITNTIGSFVLFSGVLWALYIYIVQPIFRNYKPKLKMYKIDVLIGDVNHRVLIKSLLDIEKFQNHSKEETKKYLISNRIIRNDEQSFEIESITQIYQEIV